MAENNVERVLRGKAHANGVAAGKLVETANSLKAEDFFKKYFIESAKLKLETLATSSKLDLVLKDADSINNHDLDSCMSLIEQSSKDDYAQSEMKWRPASKRKEMLLPDMRYIILKTTEKGGTAPDHVQQIVGFCSFMVTYEDGYEVIYIYEIHLSPRIQGQGLGKALMTAIESIAHQVNVSKVMLTVFRSNSRACCWYNGLAYDVDEFSPGPKRLRNGTVKESTYMILSKAMNSASTNIVH